MPPGARVHLRRRDDKPGSALRRDRQTASIIRNGAFRAARAVGVFPVEKEEAIQAGEFAGYKLPGLLNKRTEALSRGRALRCGQRARAARVPSLRRQSRIRLSSNRAK
jgi:hypothetical protein